MLESPIWKNNLVRRQFPKQCLKGPKQNAPAGQRGRRGARDDGHGMRAARKPQTRTRDAHGKRAQGAWDEGSSSAKGTTNLKGEGIMHDHGVNTWSCIEGHMQVKTCTCPLKSTCKCVHTYQEYV